MQKGTFSFFCLDCLVVRIAFCRFILFCHDGHMKVTQIVACKSCVRCFHAPKICQNSNGTNNRKHWWWNNHLMAEQQLQFSNVIDIYAYKPSAYQSLSAYVLPTSSAIYLHTHTHLRLTSPAGCLLRLKPPNKSSHCSSSRMVWCIAAIGTNHLKDAQTGIGCCRCFCYRHIRIRKCSF